MKYFSGEWIAMPKEEYDAERAASQKDARAVVYWYEYAYEIEDALNAQITEARAWAIQMKAERDFAHEYIQRLAGRIEEYRDEIGQCEEQNCKLVEDSFELWSNLLRSALGDYAKDGEGITITVRRLKAERDAALGREAVLRVGLNTAIKERDEARREWALVFVQDVAPGITTTFTVTNPTTMPKYDHRKDIT